MYINIWSNMHIYALKQYEFEESLMKMLMNMNKKLAWEYFVMSYRWNLGLKLTLSICICKHCKVKKRSINPFSFINLTHVRYGITGNYK